MYVDAIVWVVYFIDLFIYTYTYIAIPKIPTIQHHNDNAPRGCGAGSTVRVGAASSFPSPPDCWGLGGASSSSEEERLSSYCFFFY